MKRPRVLLVFSSSELGGAERSLSRMALAAQGTDYQLASLQGEGPWCDWVRSLGHQPMLLGGAGFVTAIFRLVLQARRGRYDIVYVCGARAALLLRLLRFMLPGIKLVHGVRWNPDSDSRLDRYFRPAERATRLLMDGWITNSAVAKKTLVGRCGIAREKITVIHNGLDAVPASVSPLVARPMEVLTVANLNPRKGHREYLQVMRDVLASCPGTRFVLVGRDDMNGAIQQAAAQAGLSEQVHFAGFAADVTPWYERARVFVLPSLWNEGCPTAILEAMAHAVPCVAYAIDGIPELVKSGEHGMLPAPDDQAGMTAAIIALLRDPEHAARLGRQGRERVARDFALERTASLHDAAFQRLLRQR